MSDSSQNKSRKIQEHIFVKPEATTYPRRIKGGGGYPPTEIPHEEDEEITERRSRGIKGLLGEVVAQTESKTLRDDMAYFVVDFRIKADHPASAAFLERLQSRTLAFLDKEESKVLVASGIETLHHVMKSASFPASMERIVFDIRPIRPEEQIDKAILTDKDWVNNPKNVDVFIVPNIEIARTEKYLLQAKEFLERKQVETIDFIVDKLSKSGVLNVRIDFPSTSQLLQNSSFVYRVNETPKIDLVRAESKKNDELCVDPAERMSSVKKETANVATLPEVCVIDTGVNPIQPLRNLISAKSQEPHMPDDVDHNDHGTPVAFLAAYGEKSNARARIISHKIISGSLESNLFMALARAITLYLQRTRVFTCSITFRNDDAASNFETWRIDRLVQASNACVVFSAGNIRDGELSRLMSSGLRYPSYFYNAPVMPPSNSMTIACIGSYCSRSNTTSIAPPDSPSPFTRFRTRNQSLQGCVKPEMVEHGGNLDNNLHYVGVGVNTFSSSGSPVERIGTSFSAPIVAGHLAEIACKYTSRISNAETLKAIAFSSCVPTQNFPNFVGFGKPDHDEMLGSSSQCAKIVFEGEMRLAHPDLRQFSPANRISVYVPAGVDQIELFLVHSDDYGISADPALYTYIEVVPEKPARETPPPPDQGDLNSRVHAKRLVWKYQKAVKGVWFFTLVPHHIGIPSALRPNVHLRYGGVLKLTASRSCRPSLTDQVRRNLKKNPYA